MPGMGGLEATRVARATHSRVNVCLLTLHKSTELLRAGLLAGAKGYVLKSDSEDELIEALQTVSRGEIYVTKAISRDAVSEILRQIPLQTGAKDGDRKHVSPHM